MLPELTPGEILQQQKPISPLSATGVPPDGQRGLLRVQREELRSVGMEPAPPNLIGREVTFADATEQEMRVAPQPPIDLPPSFQRLVEADYVVIYVPGGISKMEFF